MKDLFLIASINCINMLKFKRSLKLKLIRFKLGMKDQLESHSLTLGLEDLHLNIMLVLSEIKVLSINLSLLYKEM